MAVFSQRAPDDLHEALKAYRHARPWLSQNDLVNAAIAAMIGFPGYRVETAPPTLDDYLRAGALDAVTHESLRGAIVRGQRIGIFGARGSGRTSLWRALVREYQEIKTSPRRLMAITTEDGGLTNLTPLFSVSLIDPRTRSRGIQVIPDGIEAVFVDGLHPSEMPGAVAAWQGGYAGVYTFLAEDISFPGAPELNGLTDVRILLRGGHVVFLADRLAHMNSNEQMNARMAAAGADHEADVLFDDIVTHYATAQRVVATGPNSGNSKMWMTRRASIVDGSAQVGTLEVSTVELSASQTYRRITWTSNTLTMPGAALPSTTREVRTFAQGVEAIG